MSIYTCIACRVAFVDADTQRAHYKTDWHRYNLKRKVADLPSVTADNFRQRVLSAQQLQTPEEKKSSFCSLCGKNFRTANSYQNHIQSKKHKELEAKQGDASAEGDDDKNKENSVKSTQDSENKLPKEQGSLSVKEKGATADDEMEDDDSDVESVESWGDDGLGIEECLFCSFVSESLEENVKHMTVKHSFFLPDIEYLVNLEGLITYLGQKVGCGHMCLWCNEKGKRFHTSQAAQRHMGDKGHCKMLHEGDTVLEYTDFYDYRSSYPDVEDAEGDQAMRQVDGDVESMEVESDNIVSSGFELVLPSGATVGHRSLMKYYKQNLPEKATDRNRTIVPRMLAQYKALGWIGSSGPLVQQRLKDLGAVQRMKSKHYLKTGVRANKFQTHYRPQVVF